jgi:hypothetical protein
MSLANSRKQDSTRLWLRPTRRSCGHGVCSTKGLKSPI